MELQEIKQVQDAIYQRLVSGGVNISREELSVDVETLDKCRNAATLMVDAMEIQNKFYNDYSEVSVKREAGLEVDESTQKDYDKSLENCRQAIQKYSDAHILAHRTEYAAQLASYREADSSTLKKLSAYRYDRDAVDGVIAFNAAKEIKERQVQLQGKNSLLVGKNAIGDGLDQLIESNTHSPIPIKDAISAKVKVPSGEPMYPMLNPSLTQDNNDLRPVENKAQEELYGQKAEEKAAAAENQQENTAIKRVIREYNDEPSATRQRTFIAADILFEEKVQRGVKLSPDPMADKQKSKSMDLGMQDLDGILKLKTDESNGSGK